jgi:hypothetical protein
MRVDYPEKYMKFACSEVWGSACDDWDVKMGSDVESNIGRSRICLLL